jgi:hypothetical protein
MPKAKAKVQEIDWLAEPEEHDYPAAEFYLKLLFSEARVAELISKLRSAPVERFMAKDIFRASQRDVDLAKPQTTYSWSR